MSSVTMPPAATQSMTVVGSEVGSAKRMAPIQNTYPAIRTRNNPAEERRHAPMISARPQPKVSFAVAERSLRRCATSAISAPPTAEKVWRASESIATDPDHKPTLNSMTK